jgi:hypothetical protein
MSCFPHQSQYITLPFTVTGRTLPEKVLFATAKYWIVNPALPDRLRRVQWWFHFTPEGDGTRVVHEVEIDFGDLQDELLKGLRDNFEQVRAPVIRAGMDRTLENLRKRAAR